MRRIVCVILGVLLLAFSAPAYAEEEAPKTEYAGSGVLPDTVLTVEQCKSLMAMVEERSSSVRKQFEDVENLVDGEIKLPGFSVFYGGFKSAQSYAITQNDILACGIKTGQIPLWLVPYYVREVLEFVIWLAGILAVGGIVWGGYTLMFAGVSEEKDKGKKAILYSIAGMVLTLVAWALVNIVISFLTSL